MYGERPIEDTIRTLRGWTTNQIARFAPRAYVRLTGQTGRGEPRGETVAGIVEYFFQSFYDYFDILNIARADIVRYLSGKTVLEYGPGDTAGVALLMMAHGARKVFCVDRFALLSTSRHNARVLRELVRALPPEPRARAETATRLDQEGGLGLRAECIEYRVRPSGLSGLSDEVDLAYSRAVLEHVDDIDATFADMAKALKAGGTAIHQVDLRSHGLHRRNALDFLTWPQPLWKLMYSHKGMPNRWRVDHYRRAVEACGLKLQLLVPTHRAESSTIDEVRPRLAARFRDVSDKDLAWLGFWMVCKSEACVSSTC